jgi:hypothetical protein
LISALLTLPRLRCLAHLQGFDSDEVELALQRGDGADWERWPMTVEPDLEGHRFMVRRPHGTDR